MPAADPNPLRQALDVSPTNVPLRLLVADALAQSGDAAGCETLLKDGLARAPNDARLRLKLAEHYRATGRATQALVLAEPLAEGDDAPAEALALLAKLYSERGDGDEARRAYRRLLDRQPDYADADLDADLGRPGQDAPVPDSDDGRVPAIGHSDDGGGSAAEVERPKIKFNEVGGMEAVKEEIRLKVIYPLIHAELYRAYGKAVGGGVLLYGPPGCGKTHLARATAGEVQAAFLSVGLHEVLDMWLGGSEKNLHSLFQQARRNAPCVLFFDEVDALAASRSDFRQNNARLIINQFLSELDGVNTSNDGVLILAATNAPWHMDSAFRRPGRFDRILFVPPPDAPARAAILKLCCEGKPQDGLDFATLGQAAKDLSGADLKAVVDRAVEAKLQEALKTGVPKPLTTKDLAAALKLVPPSTREWLADAKNYALYANEGGQYDDLAKYLKLR